MAGGLSPASMQQGAINLETVATGTGFQPGATVKMTGPAGYLVGSIRSTTSWVSSTELSLTQLIVQQATVGAYSVVVTNPDGGRVNCANCFTVTTGPQVTSMSPNTVTRNSVQQVTITGTNFAPGITILGPGGVTFDAISVPNSTTVVATMTVGGTAARTVPNQTIQVINRASAGGGSYKFPGLTITP